MAEELLVVVAAVVGGVPGTRQVVRQFAAAELQIIMQLVTLKVCASRILPSAKALLAAALIAAASKTNPNPRIATPPA